MDRCSGDRTSRRRGARYMNDRKRWTFVHAALQKFRWRFFGHCNSQNCHGQERTAEKSTGHGTGVRASDVFNGSGCFFSPSQTAESAEFQHSEGTWGAPNLQSNEQFLSCSCQIRPIRVIREQIPSTQHSVRIGDDHGFHCLLFSYSCPQGVTTDSRLLRR
jgi:hypothetical protein